MKLLKRIIFTCLAIVLILIAAVVIIIFTLDPNRLKPTLEEAAAKAGTELTISGDISWTLYPSIGLNLGELSLKHIASNQGLAAAEQTQVSVQLMPLLKQQILVNGIHLDGLELNYTILGDGTDIWSSLLDTPENTPNDTEIASKSSDATELAINKVNINNATLTYANNQTGDNAQATIVKFNSNNITLTGDLFPVELQVKTSYNNLPNAIISLNSDIGLNLEQQSINIPKGKLNLKTGDSQLQLTLNSNTTWAPTISSTGSVALAEFNLPLLLKSLKIEPPQTSNPNALKKVAANFSYIFKDNSIELNPVDLNIDGFSLSGLVIVSNLEAPQITTNWTGTNIILDDYLPPATEPQQAAPTPEPTPLPMEALQALNMNAKIAINQITYTDLILKQTNIELLANNGTIKLKNLSSNIADGTLASNGILDARGKEAKLKMNVQSQNINLGALLKSFADLDQVQGNASLALDIESHGKTDQDLINNLKVTGNAESESLYITPFNIEQQFCKAMAMLHRAEEPSFEWEQKTQLKPVKMQFNLAENSISLNSLSAEIAHLMGAANGSLNLTSGKFNIPLSLSLGDFAGDIEGCLPIKQKWRDRKLPIRCKGSLDEIGVTTCLPDASLIADMLKEKIKTTAKEKVDKEKERAEDKLKDKAKELLKDKLGENSKTENTLRDIFKKLKD